MPSCSACAAPAIAQWQRRATVEELSAERARVQEWRDECLQQGDVPADHDFGPLPAAADVTIPVYGCVEHAIHMDLAAHIHAADCAAPSPNHLPGCGCQPEPLLKPEPDPRPAVITLSTGWIIPAPTQGAA